MKSKQTTRTLCEGAIMVAMAVVLNFFKFDLFAQGGSMNLLFIPLMVFALRRGPVWGMGAGLVFGVLKAIIGGGIAYGWQSLLLDYALAYALTGLAGFTPKKPVLGTVIGALGALLSFVLSGVFVWGEYMPDVFLGMAMKNVWIYSFIYNFIYTAFNWLIAAIVIYFLSKKTKLLQPEIRDPALAETFWELAGADLAHDTSELALVGQILDGAHVAIEDAGVSMDLFVAR